MKSIHKVSTIRPVAPFIIGPAAQWTRCGAAFYGERGALVMDARHVDMCAAVGTGWNWTVDSLRKM